MPTAPVPGARKAGLDDGDTNFLKPNPLRWVMFPIQYDDFWKAYKAREEIRWSAEDFSYAADSQGFQALKPGPRAAVSCLVGRAVHELAQLPMVAFVSQLMTRVESPEARAFYGFQVVFEIIRAEVYNSVLDVAQPQLAGKDALLAESEGDPHLAAKAAWWEKHSSGELSVTEHVFCSVVFWTVFAASARLQIVWMSQQDVLPEIREALRQTEKDLHVHAAFAALVYKASTARYPTEEAHRIVGSAVRVEAALAAATLAPLDFSRAQIDEALHFLADSALSAAGHPSLDGGQCCLTGLTGMATEWQADWDAHLKGESRPQAAPLPLPASAGPVEYDEDF